MVEVLQLPLLDLSEHLLPGASAGDLCACQRDSERQTACGLDQGLETADSAPLYREIAASCQKANTANLNYNRAYFMELLESYRTTLRLEAASGQEDLKNYHAYRIFIGLTEALTRQQAAGSGDQADWLNTVYDRASEIAELRLRGYELQANHLEQKVWKNDAP